MNLFEINEEIEKCFDEETGEIFDIESLEQLSMKRDEKIENIALLIKNLKADAEALKAEKLAFTKRQSVVENKVKGLQRYLQNALSGEKFQTSKVSISYRSSEQLELLDMDDFMKNDNAEQFLKFSDPTLDKNKIKDEMKKGVEFKGVTLTKCSNIQIK